ncbi:MAG TPA: universal stress protein [Nitriliruptorales bacterium]
MDAYREIIVGTDGSPTATCAVLAAIEVARACKSTLSVATAWYRHMPDEPVPSEKVKYPGGNPAAQEARWAGETANDAASIARSAGLADVRSLSPEGNAADALLRLAEERRDVLLVVGTLGLSDRTERLLGNIPHQITHHSIRDVLLVRTDGCEDGYAWSSVALATDGSKTAAEAVRHGLALANALGATATLLTVAKDRAAGEEVLDRVAADLPDGHRLDRRIVEAGTDVAHAIADGAGEFDLLVLGNKGMSGPSRLLGSVANKVTHLVPTDLLLVNTTR